MVSIKALLDYNVFGITFGSVLKVMYQTAYQNGKIALVRAFGSVQKVVDQRVC